MPRCALPQSPASGHAAHRRRSRTALGTFLFVALLAAMLPMRSVSAMPSQEGEWSEVLPWEFIPIHAFVDEFERVITYGGTRDGGQGGFEVDIWTPSQGAGSDAHRIFSNDLGSNIFCSTSIQSAVRGSTLILGGETSRGNFNDFAAEFDDDSMNSATSLEEGRWYPTATNLADGRIVLQGGVPDGFGGRSNPVTVAEIWSPSTATWRRLEGTRDLDVWKPDNYAWWYPRAFATPDGLVWTLAWDQMFYLDPDGAGSITRLGTFPTSNYGATSAAVMFDSGKVLIAGGGERGSDDTRFIGSNEATIVDLNTNPPTLTAAADMTFRRHWADAIVLPDGKVLVVGGSEVNNNNQGVAYAPELWDPATDTWTVLAANATPRLYHSTATLLPDGSVFTGGGGAPGPQDNLDAEVFYPPYLFEDDGSRAAGPQVSGAPRRVSHGENFSIEVDGRIDRLTFVKTNNSTHSLNSQIFQELSFTQSGGTVSTAAPSEPSIATPGLYMLFALDQDGVPSNADMVWLNESGPEAPPPVLPPAVGDSVLVNGSFENSDVASGSWGLVDAPGWTSTGSIELWDNHNGIAASEGDQFAELNGTGPDTMTQVVNVVAGANYDWSIDHRGRVNEDTLEVFIDGVSQGQFSADAGAWVRHSGSVTAASASMTIAFQAIDAGRNGNLIDNVRLVGPEAPPPAPPPVLPPADGDSVLVNGGFESSDVASGSWGFVDAPGWTSTGSIELWDNHRGIAASEGDQFAELNGTGPDTMTQVVNVVAGENYEWSIDHQGRRDVDTLEVFIDGVSQGQFSADAGAWVRHSGTVTASSASMTIAFQAIDQGKAGNLIDNVRLVGAEAPLPGVGVNALVNGGFESSDVAPGAWGFVDAPGWTSTGSIELWDNHRGIAASEGDQFAELNGTGPDTMTQVVNVVAGGTYEWSIDHQGRRNVDTLEVFIDGVSQGQFSADAGAWVRHSGTATASSASMAIAFRAIDDGKAGNLIDNAQLVLTG